VYIDALEHLRRHHEIVGVDLAPKRRRGIQIVAADIRRLPWADGHFDVILCVSTLEHIGMDNSEYGWRSRPGDRQDIAALVEMARVLAVDGRLLVTVPLGESGNYGWFHQYDLVEWSQVAEAAGLRTEELAIYKQSEVGWIVAPADAPPDRRYGEGATRFANGVLCTALTRA
jgi:SAM-dependent methyltransferase